MNDSLLICVGLAFIYREFTISRLQGRFMDLDAKLSKLLDHFGIDGSPPGTSASVEELARDPRTKIAAIKAYREQTGAGLKDAKAAVEKIAGMARPLPE